MQFLPTLACHLRYAVVLIVIIIILVLLSKWSASSNTTIVKMLNPSASNTADAPVTPAHTAAAGKLATQANKWHTKSSRATNSRTALIYASYALGYMDAALDLVHQNNQTLQTAVDFDVEVLSNSLRELQQQLVDANAY